MPRKSTKTAPQGENSAQEGVTPPSIAQILNEAASKGKPEGLAAKGEEKKKTGRPSTYNPEAAQKMCELLSDGVPLREICRMEGMPIWRTVYNWMYADDALGEKGVGLSSAIARAREVGYDAIAEDILSEMTQEPERILSEGGGRIDSGYVQLIKARAEIKLKLLAKWNPKKYGDRLVHAGDAENPLEIQNDAMTILAAAVKNLELKRQTVNER